MADASETPKTMAERLEIAFSDTAPQEQAVQFYDRVMERLKDLISSLRRSIFGLLLIAAVIQLFDLRAISDFQFGPIKLSDLKLVHKFLPVVAAYLIYDIVATVIRYIYAHRIAVEFDRVYRRKLSVEPFYRLIYPAATNILLPSPPFEQQTAALRLINGFKRFFMIAFSVTPFLLIVYWYVRLFSRGGFQDFSVYISAAMSICLLAYAVLLYWQAVIDGMVGNIFKGKL